MGGYPSHDAPNLLFATAAQHPNNGGTTEISLIPLVRRHFNDTNKKLKDAVAQIYFGGPPNTYATATAALQQSNAQGGGSGSNNMSAVTGPDGLALPPGAPLPPSAAMLPNGGSLPAGLVPPIAPVGAAPADVSAEQKRKAVQAYKSLENLLSEIECSFFASTRVVYESAKFAQEKVRVKEALRAAAEAAKEAGKGDEAVAKLKFAEALAHAAAEEGQAAAGLHAGRIPLPQLNTSAPVLRPVPCAVCIIEPDTSGRKGSSGGGGGGGSSGTHGGGSGGVNGAAATAQASAQSAEWVSIQGRRLRCIGYISCFAKRPSDEEEAKASAAATSMGAAASTAAADAGSGPQSPLSMEGKPSQSVPRISECEAKGLDVYMELILANESKYVHLLEPVVFLASIMFRSQYLTSSMLQRAVHSTEVESAFYAHLQLLNIHVRLTKDRVHHLNVLQDRLPLVEFVDEMGLNGKHFASPSVGGEAHTEGGDAAADDGEKESKEGAADTHSATGEGHRDASPSSGVEGAAAVAGGGESVSMTTAEEENIGEKKEASAAAAAAESAAGGESADRKETSPDHKHKAEDSEDDGDGSEDDDEDELADHDATARGETAANAGDGADTTAAGDAGGATAGGEPHEMDGDEDGNEHREDGATDGDKENLPSNLSNSGTNRRTRRSRRRQRKPKVAQPQDEVYRKTSCHLPALTLFRNSEGEPEGVEAVFDGALLARLMKLVAETAAFETVKNSFIRCDLGPLMKERRHLLQSHREAMQKEGSAARQDERLMGSTENAEIVSKWIKEGLVAEEEKRKREEAAAAIPPPILAAAQPSQVQQQQQAQAGSALNAHLQFGSTDLSLNPQLARKRATLASAAASTGHNPAALTMLSAADQPHAAGGATAPAGAPGAPMMMLVPGMGYVQMPSNPIMMQQAAAPSAAPSAQPTYIINPATGQPMLITPASAAQSAGAAGAGTPPQAQMLGYQNAMQLHAQQQAAAQVQAHAQAQQQAVLSATPSYYAQHQGAVPTQHVQHQVQQPQYQYVVGPNGQLLMVPVISAAAQQQPQPPQQQYMMAAASPAYGGQMQLPVYMNPYMMMNMTPEQQQQQQQQQQLQLQMQQMYVQQLISRQQGQQQLQAMAAAGHPFMMAPMPGMQLGQQHSGAAVGANSMNVSTHGAHTPSGTPPQQGSAAAGVAGAQYPPHLAASYANMSAMATATQQQQQQVQGRGQSSSTAGSTPVQGAKPAPKIGSGMGSGAPGVAGTPIAAGGDAQERASPPHAATSFNFATINDDDDDDDAVALAAATAAMEAIRGHGGAHRGGADDDDDDDDEEDTSQFFSNGHFFFRTQ